MLIFNITALVCAGVGILGGLASYQVTGSKESVVYAALLIAILVDVWCRFRDEETDNAILDPDAGGHVWFVPVWILGIVLSILCGLSYFGVF